MKRGLLLGVLVALGLGACGGQSAQQRLATDCQARAQRWAQDYVAPFSDPAPQATVDGLAQSAAQTCIDSNGHSLP